MADKSVHGGLLAAGMIALSVGCVSIGYGLCSIVNGLDGGAVLAGAGAAGAAISSMLFTRALQGAKPEG